MKATRLPTRRRGYFPWEDANGIEGRLKTLFDDPFTFGTVHTLGWTPTVDVAETDQALLLTAELPGVEEKDVEIELEGNVLTIRGEKKEMSEKEEMKGERRMRIWERRYGEFSRSFTLPNTVDAESIRAEFAKGLLTVHLPKTQEAKGRRIEIHATR